MAVFFFALRFLNSIPPLCMLNWQKKYPATRAGYINLTNLKPTSITAIFQRYFCYY